MKAKAVLAAAIALASLGVHEARAAVPPAVLALIVTNNRGAGLDRPDLRYADDDGVNPRRTAPVAHQPTLAASRSPFINGEPW